MEYSRRPIKNIPKENQLKILNKIYQTYLVSTTIFNLDFFILDLTPGIMLLTKDDWKMRWEIFQVFGFGATYIRGMTATIFLVNWLDPFHIHGLMQDCSNSIANALELLQSCAKPSIYDLWAHHPNLVKVCIAYACKISIMMMSSNGNSFHITGPFLLTVGIPLVTGGFPSQRTVMQSFDVSWFVPEQTVQQTIETPVIWDAILNQHTNHQLCHHKSAYQSLHVQLQWLHHSCSGVTTI